MKLSEINEIKKDYIKNEKEFDTLGILDSVTEMTLCTFLDDEKYIEKLNSNITMLITKREIYEKLKHNNIGFYIVESPRIVFFELHNILCKNKNYIREKFNTKIGKNCDINKLSHIAEDNVIIGNNVIIEEFVSIKENTVIGDNCKIGAGTVIGGEGFEFKRLPDKINSVKHAGGVIIKNNVEVKYNATIDKAIYPWDNTVIDEYTKIDNLNHIGHACKIGKRVLMPSGSTIGGRTVVEDDVWIGINCAIRNGMNIGEGSRCNMGAIVTKDVKSGESVTGNFAINHEKFIANMKKSIIGE